MSTEENKAIVRRFQEIWKGNVAIIDELVAPDTLIAGMKAEQFKAEVLAFCKRMPDITLTVEEMIAEDDKVVCRWTMKGTHTSDFPTPYGVAKPTGKTITSKGITINRLENGKIVEDRYISDDFEYWIQLGAIPAPPQNS